MRIFITMQKAFKRGTLPPYRISGVTYAFEWNDKIQAYAWEAPSLKAANELLVGCHSQRLVIIPGIYVTDEKPVKAITPAKAVLPEQTAPAPAESVESPVNPEPQTTPAQSPASPEANPSAKKGASKGKGKKGK